MPGRLGWLQSAAALASALAATGMARGQDAPSPSSVPVPAASAAPAGADERLERLQRALAEQTRQLDELRRALVQQEAQLDAMRRGLLTERQAGAAAPLAAGAASLQSPSQTPAPAQAQTQAPQSSSPPPAPARTSAAIEVAPATAAPKLAPIFEHPGVLTPAGKYAFEPSLQYAYASSNRVSLVGYTVIPAVLVGLIDVREVKRSTFTGAVALRRGLTNRLEVEAKLPYVWRSDTSVVRQTNDGQNGAPTAFGGSGHGVGDAELTARYQLNAGGGDSAFYVASLRFKSRTGVDPYEIPVSTRELDLRGDGAPSRLATGSGFVGLQPALTVLVPSDPAVIFGSVSWLHSFARSNVVRPTDAGPEPLGRIAPGGIFGFNVGMGLALNEKASFSIGYDHASVGKTRQNGVVAADSVRLQLGTLLLGYAFRLDDRRSVNLSLGAGLTRDTPDVALTVRTPTSF